MGLLLRVVALAGVVTLASCFEDPTFVCGELACPAGTVCTPGGCATPDEVGACEGLADGEACVSSRLGNGVCFGGACRVSVCGNGVIEPGERCDDANAMDGDGCARDCRSDETCGNAVRDQGEECDDGNTDGGDGCQAACLLPRCGDLVRDVAEGEACDDGNTADGDGCSRDCRSSETCGNDLRDAVEQCDEGDTRNLDGCSAICTIESETWKRTLDGASPDPRIGSALAYDAARGRTVLFGGAATEELSFSDTWEWNGAAWERLVPLSPPEARSGHAMVYDAARHRVVLFGGGNGTARFGDTWEWDGAQWQRVATTGPAARAGHALAYDRVGQRVVMYGGTTDAGASDEVWTWNGTAWTELALANGPPASDLARLVYAGDRLVVFASDATTWELVGTTWSMVANTGPAALPGATLVYDSKRELVVLFGPELWTWDGDVWAPGTQADGPSARTLHAAAFDATRGTIVVFGGTDGAVLRDTWLDDGTWTRGGLPSLPTRTDVLLAFDSARGVTVMVSDDEVRTTWLWDGERWTPAAPTTQPPRQRYAAISYDSATSHVVVFGGAHSGSVSDDTWRWNGTDWSLLTGTVLPPERAQHAMAYDAARGCTILFGGTNDTQLVAADTWKLCGTTWSLAASASQSPAPRKDHVMAYDPVRQQVVMHGGWDGSSDAAFNDTWEWDGVMWKSATSGPPLHSHTMTWDGTSDQLLACNGVLLQGAQADQSGCWTWNGTTWGQTAGPATPRTRPGLAYDSVHDRVVLFGGSEAGRHIDDTWLWDGATWSGATNPAYSPTSRASPAVAYDSIRQRIVVFGGDRYDDPLLADTWEWTGARWEVRAPATSPPQRTLAAMAYDPIRQRTVLFGGAVGLGGTPSNYVVDADTWEWNGTTWIPMAPTASPPARCRHAMVYDRTLQRIVMVGGMDEAGTDFEDMWSYDGTSWTLIAPAQQPPARHSHAMAHDAVRGRTVLFGGVSGALNDPTHLADTWEWDGTTWTESMPALAPTPRREHSMTYDPYRGRVVLFGGDSDEQGGKHQDTWTWDGMRWTAVSASPVPERRDRAAFAYDEARAALVLFSGSSESRIDDTWILRTVPQTTSEACAAGTDYDRDGLAGCADDDCWAWCTPVCPPDTSCPAGAARCGDGVCQASETSAFCSDCL